MIYHHETELKDRIEEVTGRPALGRPEVVTDTSDYLRVVGGMVLRLEGRDYFIQNEARETRFGIEDQPKFWVKYGLDLETGGRKVIKMVFHEDFTYRMGPFLIRCTRSPEKEADILRLVQKIPAFMQGHSLRDPAGNLVRIIDFISGPDLFSYVNALPGGHETYFHQVLPGLMKRLIDAFEWIQFLHYHDEHHGDVRPDHLIIARDTGKFTWIDFDFKVSYGDFDTWSLGEVLIFLAGKGMITHQEVLANPGRFGIRQKGLTLGSDDSIFFFQNQVANLGKIFPYIPQKLNRIFLNFSLGTSYFYEDIGTFIEELKEACF